MSRACPIVFHIDIGTQSDRFKGLKAYGLDLRERVVKFIHRGGAKTEAARRFNLGRRTVCRYLATAQKETLSPKTSWGHLRKLDPHQLHAHVKKHPAATRKELQQVFGVSHHAVGVRLRQLGFTLKKLAKYRERNGVQRWLFRRELEKLAGTPAFYWDERDADHTPACRETPRMVKK
ncbi:MAG: IS630 transposase-related protein [Verrucomicrobiota bacterium]